MLSSMVLNSAVLISQSTTTQCIKRAQHSPVGLVTPRNQAVSTPSSLTQHIEATVITDPGIRIRLQDAATLVCHFGQLRPGER